MNSIWRLAILSVVLLLVQGVVPPAEIFRDPHSMGVSQGNYTPTPYQVGWYETQLDHFNFEVNTTFKMRYLYSHKFFENTPEKPGPIFVYTGNEGSIDMFWNNTGYWTNVLAPKYGAYLLFLEHRYFGESLPFGEDSLKGKNPQYLSSEQALADYGVFLQKFKEDNNLQNSPVISVGGSYGGMLSGWFRMKYPQVVDGALAASAPLLMYQNITSPYVFDATITKDFTDVGCGGYMRTAFDLLYDLQDKPEYQDTLNKELNLCDSVEVQTLYYWVQSALRTMSMLDYPYPTNFVTPLPASPVTEACEAMISALGENKPPAASSNFLGDDVSDVDVTLLKGLVAAANVFYNPTGKDTCNGLDLTGAGNAAEGWWYLACTEQNLPIASNGVTDFFWKELWNEKEYSMGCEDVWGVPTRPFWAPRHYGGFNYQRDFQMYSNIIFSQGDLDPWHLGGVNKSIKGAKDMISFVMEGAAHHLDLRYPDPADPIAVVEGRKLEDLYIGKWIRETIERNLQEPNQ